MERTVKKIQQINKTVQDRQKSYVDKKIIHIEFKVGDHFYLRIKPHKSTLYAGNCANLVACYCGPFEFLEIVERLAYRLALPSHIKVQFFFHVV